MIKIFHYLKVSLLIVFLVSFIYADDDEYYEREHFPWDMSFLNLNKSQKKDIKNILIEYRQKLYLLHKKEKEFNELLVKNFIDKFDYNIVFEKNLSLKKEYAKIEIDFYAKVYKVLDKKQRKLFIKYYGDWDD